MNKLIVLVIATLGLIFFDVTQTQELNNSNQNQTAGTATGGPIILVLKKQANLTVEEKGGLLGPAETITPEGLRQSGGQKGSQKGSRKGRRKGGRRGDRRGGRKGNRKGILKASPKESPKGSPKESLKISPKAVV